MGFRVSGPALAAYQGRSCSASHLFGGITVSVDGAVFSGGGAQKHHHTQTSLSALDLCVPCHHARPKKVAHILFDGGRSCTGLVTTLLLTKSWIGEPPMVGLATTRALFQVVSDPAWLACGSQERLGGSPVANSLPREEIKSLHLPRSIFFPTQLHS